MQGYVSDLKGNPSQLFESVAIRFPGRVAISNEGDSILYAELNERANWIAHRLLEANCANEEIVAIAGEDPIARWAGVFGAWKAGASIVILDPTYSDDQLRHILADSDARFLLIGEAAYGAMAARCADLGCSPTLLCLSRAGDERSCINPVCSTPQAAAAVVIYTSGSTGNAKGVIRSHRMLMRGRWLKQALDELVPDVTYTVMGSGALAAAFIWFLYPLLHGCTVCAYPSHAKGLQNLGQHLFDTNTHMLVSPLAMLRLWSSALQAPVTLPRLRSIYTIGTAILGEDIHRLREKIPGGWDFRSGYGMTEILNVTSLCIPSSMTDLPVVLPAGRLISDFSKVFLIDENRLPVKQGELGQVLIQSEYLSSGYLHAPELTAQRYLKDWQGQATPVFLTGDLGRFDAHGNLWLVGRNDDMVKVRGHRIATAEVEARLLKTPGVVNAVVLARKTADFDHELIAFVQPADGVEVTSLQLRRRLLPQMPRPMLPAHIVMLRAIPLLANGKPDRQTLLTLPLVESTGTPQVGPRNPEESAIHTIWCQVLGKAQISIHELFVEAGGDSFAAAQLETRLIAQFGERISYFDLIRLPTIAAQGEHVRQAQRANPSKTRQVQLHALNMVDSTETLFCMPDLANTQDHMREVARLMPDTQLFGISLPTTLDGRPLYDSVAQLATTVEPAIVALQPTGPYFLMGSCNMGRLALETASRLTARGFEIGAVIIVDAPGKWRSSRPGITARGTWRWLRQAWRSTNVLKLEPNGRVRALRDMQRRIIRRLTLPRSRRGTARMRRFQEAFHAMCFQHVVLPSDMRVVLIKGGWSQIALHFEAAGPNMGWDNVFPNIETLVVPSSHSSMYSQPFASAFALALRRGMQTRRG